MFCDQKAIITSNRDEKVLRPSALPPEKYVINDKDIYFPKDPFAGGTWYAVAENGAVLVLLNGAEERHQLKPNYRKSRGLIVLELISATSCIKAWEASNLEEIEPFTIVLFQDHRLYQLRWDEINKSTIELDLNSKYIWSSSTLYSKEIREGRKQLFEAFVDSNEVNQDSIFDFHRCTNAEDTENGLIINRAETLKTLSITQSIVSQHQVEMVYFDLQKQEKSSLIIEKKY